MIHNNNGRFRWAVITYPWSKLAGDVDSPLLYLWHKFQKYCVTRFPAFCFLLRKKTLHVVKAYLLEPKRYVQ